MQPRQRAFTNCSTSIAALRSATGMAIAALTAALRAQPAPRSAQGLLRLAIRAPRRSLGLPQPGSESGNPGIMYTTIDEVIESTAAAAEAAAPAQKKGNWGRAGLFMTAVTAAVLYVGTAVAPVAASVQDYFSGDHKGQTSAQVDSTKQNTQEAYGSLEAVASQTRTSNKTSDAYSGGGDGPDPDAAKAQNQSPYTSVDAVVELSEGSGNEFAGTYRDGGDGDGGPRSCVGDSTEAFGGTITGTPFQPITLVGYITGGMGSVDSEIWNILTENPSRVYEIVGENLAGATPVNIDSMPSGYITGGTRIPGGAMLADDTNIHRYRRVTDDLIEVLPFIPVDRTIKYVQVAYNLDQNLEIPQLGYSVLVLMENSIARVINMDGDSVDVPGVLVASATKHFAILETDPTKNPESPLCNSVIVVDNTVYDLFSNGSIGSDVTQMWDSLGSEQALVLRQGGHTIVEHNGINWVDHYGELTPPDPSSPWTPINIQQYLLATPEIKGDMDCDGLVTMADLPYFVAAVLDPIGYIPPGDCSVSKADTNRDEEINGLDIQSFMALLIPPP